MPFGWLALLALYFARWAFVGISIASQGRVLVQSLRVYVNNIDHGTIVSPAMYNERFIFASGVRRKGIMNNDRVVPTRLNNQEQGNAYQFRDSRSS